MQRAKSLDAFGEIGVSQILTYTYTHHASVCVSMGLWWGRMGGVCDTITHHVDRALGRSLLRWESGENRFNEQQTTQGERWRDTRNERNCTTETIMAG